MAEEKGFGSTLAIVVGGILLVVIAGNKLTGSSEPAPAATPTVSATPSSPSSPDYWLKQRAEREVKKTLKDPESATFTDMTVRRSPALVVCGRVNSRNGFGGMGGAQRFVSGTITALEEQIGPGEMTQLWDKVC